ncbi:related to integral membrane protein [Phialocephala subalpina]|uniref:Related to integral membrane protein n=1 Tax=Phialocephala subalpina TaxID=576137 RepID=A0A1L7XLK4_9HELO|nr:related to integral membrane protein [Phialocephala subalpina]
MVTVQPKGDGVALLYTSILLLALSWATFATRLGVRIWRKALGLDDYAMFLGLLLFTVTASLCIVCSFYGSGQLADVLPASTRMRGTKLFFIAEFFYASGAVAIKCSIAITLLRIADTRRQFVWVIWSIMIASFLSSVIFIIGVANICHPITTLWGETTTGSCNLKLNSDVSFFFSAIEIATDWALAILPGVLLWNIQMKSKVKASVALILGMAAFASCATIVRLRYLSLYSNPAEFMFSTGKIGLWSVIEEGIGIFAGSLPALRPLLSLRFLNGSAHDGSNSASAGNKFNKPRTGRYHGSADVKLDTFHQLGDKDEDGDSQKHILKETHVTMTNEQSNQPAEWERSQVLGWKKDNFSSQA